MLKEFKEFAMKGNMLDLAIGFILGVAFATVVNSLVNDIIMPIVASIAGSPDFSNLFVVLRSPTDMTEVNVASIESIREAGGIALGYGLFINALISFLLMAFVLYIIVKNVNRFKQKEEEASTAPTGVSQEELLTEIRDLLRKS